MMSVTSERAEDAAKPESSTMVNEMTVDLSALNVEEKAEDTVERPDCSKGKCPSLAGAKEEGTVERDHLDEVLIDALRIPRDRIFILKQEKDMEERIRSGTEQEWELPLMNSYQRLLVHRIADHFHLAHSIEATTKAVTLTRQEDTCIPEMSISTMAITDVERLSEPASSMRFPAAETGPLKDGSTSFGAFKIMRREGAGRSGSSRNGSGSGEAGMGKDRRNMTIEEREAAYKEARQRIFGSEDAAIENVQDLIEVDGKGVEGESSTTKVSSRKGTPGRVSPAPSSASSSSSAAFLRAGAPSFDPGMRGGPSSEAQWQQQYTYPMMDANGQQYYPYSGGYSWPVLQHDANGRHTIPNGNGPLASPPYQLPTPGSSSSNQDVYSSVGPSPSISSRSTSIGADAEGEGTQSSGSRSAGPEQSYAATAGSRLVGQINNRAQSVSPTVPFHGNPGVNTYYGGGSNNVNGGPHVYQGQVPVPASWNYYQTPTMTHNNNGNVMRPFPVQVNPTMNGEDGSGRVPAPIQAMGYAAAVQGYSRGNPMPSSSGSSSHSSSSSSIGPGYLNQAVNTGFRGEEGGPAYHLSSSTGSRGRGRSSQTERSLFDPNKPAGSSNSSSSIGSSNRQALGKSASAAGMLESRSTSDPLRSNGIEGASSTQDVNRRVSSSSSSNLSNDSLRRVTPPCHPSLPARPDWVLHSKSNKNAIDETVEQTVQSTPQQ